MKLIYIIGPYTAPTQWETERNIRRAEEAALNVAQLGAMPVCPHTMTRFWGGTMTPAFWYDGTLALMRTCGAVIVLPRCDTSVGSKREIATALSDGMFVFDYSISGMELLEAWLKTHV